MVLLTAALAAIAGWAGVRYGLSQSRPRPGLDQIMHHQLGLTADQNRRIETLEAGYAARRAALESEMRVADRDLAAAITTEHAYGPRAQQAMKRFHAAMGALQEETIKHVLAMRTVLTPEQAKRFDKTVSKALAPDGP
jgi:Spy/CpxP family protein refolding chaperone